MQHMIFENNNWYDTQTRMDKSLHKIYYPFNRFTRHIVPALCGTLEADMENIV